MKHEESRIQEMVVRMLKLQYKNLLTTGGFAGEKLSIGQAMRRKRMGYVAGSPDLLIFKAKGKYHGLMIELKTSKGVQSPEQKLFEKMALKEGYQYLVCHSALEATLAISNYMAQEEYSNGK